jgi:pimeloyl-ACP methyl ester carboxylesterase
MPDPAPYAQPADDEMLTAQQQYAATHPWFSVRRLDARSHFPMLEAPEAMVAQIESFLQGLS